MTAHYTPAPWEFEYTEGANFSMISAGNLVVCGIPNDHEYSPLDVAERVKEEAFANARLISAAPELAEMLLSIFVHVSHGGPTREAAERLLRKAGVL